MHWSRTSSLVRSPLVRLAAAVPTVGYFVLYGDAFADMFSFTDKLGSEYLFLSAQMKVRMLYYGGLCIGVALLIYLWRCPEICKRNQTKHEAHDEFVRIGGSTFITLNVERVDELNRQLDKEEFQSILYLTTFLVSEIYGELDAAEQQLIQDEMLPNIAGEQTLSGQHGDDELRKMLSGLVIEQRDSSNALTEGYREFYNTFLHLHYANASRSPKVRDTAKLLYGFFSAMAERSRRFSQLVVWNLSVAGIVLASLPAVDVFMQVVLTDTGLISLIRP